MSLNKLKNNKKIQDLARNTARRIAYTIVLCAFMFSLSIPLASRSTVLSKSPLNSAYLSQKDFEKQLNQRLVFKSARSIKAIKKEEKKQIKPDMIIAAVVTAYTSTPDQTDDSPFIAATGKRVYDGMIAANNLPFGTKIKLPDVFGEKIFTVDDRMNQRYSLGRMDVWMDTPRQEAMQFGVKYTKAEIYYPEYILTRR